MKNNQYTYSPREAGGKWVYSYDENGNMITRAVFNAANLNRDYELDNFDIAAFNVAYGNQDIEADLTGDGEVDFFDITAFLSAYGQGGDIDNEQYSYNFQNQLIKIEYKTGPNTVTYSVTNTYDPFARRVLEISDGVGGLSKKQMVYGSDSLWDVIEQIQLATPTSSEFSLSSHVFGLGIDNEVSYRIESSALDLWSHRDDQSSLTSITDDAGTVKERYQYGDYGQVSIFDSTGVERAESIYGATHLYTGRLSIAGTRLQDSRWRVLDTETGRFIQRDPLGYADSLNPFVYTMNSPASRRDPFGLQSSNPNSWTSSTGGGNENNYSFTGGDTGLGWYMPPWRWTANPGGAVQEVIMGSSYNTPYTWTFPVVNNNLITINTAGRTTSGRVRKATFLYIPFTSREDKPGIFKSFDEAETNHVGEVMTGALDGYPCSVKKRFTGDCEYECPDGSTIPGKYDFNLQLAGEIEPDSLGRYFCNSSESERHVDPSMFCTK